VLHYVSQLARCGCRRVAARGDIHHGRGFDGDAGHRRESSNPPGDRTWGRHRRRLRALSAQRATRGPARRSNSPASLSTSSGFHRQSRGPGGRHSGRRCGDLGLVAYQVSGRHGNSADVHVHMEHGWRASLDPRAVALSPAAVARRRSDGLFRSATCSHGVYHADLSAAQGGQEFGTHPWNSAFTPSAT